LQSRRILRTHCLQLEWNIEAGRLKFFPNVGNFVPDRRRHSYRRHHPVSCRYIGHFCAQATLTQHVIQFLEFQHLSCGNNYVTSFATFWKTLPGVVDHMRHVTISQNCSTAIFFVLITRTDHKTADIYSPRHHPQHCRYNRPPSALISRI
jgi:hypothetical protein